MQAMRMIKGGNKFGLEEQIRSRQLSRGGMNKTSVGDLLGWAQGESSDLVSQREKSASEYRCTSKLQSGPIRQSWGPKPHPVQANTLATVIFPTDIVLEPLTHPRSISFSSFLVEAIGGARWQPKSPRLGPLATPCIYCLV